MTKIRKNPQSTEIHNLLSAKHYKKEPNYYTKRNQNPENSHNNVPTISSTENSKPKKNCSTHMQNLSYKPFKSYTLIQLHPSHKKDQAQNKGLIDAIYTFKLNFVPMIIIIYSMTTSQSYTLVLKHKARIQLKKYGIKPIVCNRTINY